MIQFGILIARITVGLGGLVRSSLDNEEGQTLAEYGLILSLVAVVVIGVLFTISGTIGGLFSAASSQI